MLRTVTRRWSLKLGYRLQLAGAVVFALILALAAFWGSPSRQVYREYKDITEDFSAVQKSLELQLEAIDSSEFSELSQLKIPLDYNVLGVAVDSSVFGVKDIYNLPEPLPEEGRITFHQYGDRLTLYSKLSSKSGQIEAVWVSRDIDLAQTRLAIEHSDDREWKEENIEYRGHMGWKSLFPCLVILFFVFLGLLALRPLSDFFRKSYWKFVLFWLLFLLLWRVVLMYLLFALDNLGLGGTSVWAPQVLANVAGFFFFFPLSIRGLVFFKDKRYWWSMLHYFSVGLILVGYLIYVRTLTLHFHPVLSSGGLFRQGAEELAVYFALLLPVIPIVGVVIREMIRVKRWEESSWKRALYSLPMVVMVSGFLWIDDLGSFLLVFVLLFFIFFLLLEVFSIQSRWNFGWILVFLVWTSLYSAVASESSYRKSFGKQLEYNSRALMIGPREISTLDYLGARFFSVKVESLRALGMYAEVHEQDKLVWQNSSAWPESQVRSLPGLKTLRPTSDLRVELRQFVKPVSLASFFSYHFAILSVSLLSLLLLYSYIPTSWKGTVGHSLKSENSLGDKIQSAIIASILFSFAIIALITLIFFRDRMALGGMSERQRQEAYVKNLNDMGLDPSRYCEAPYCHFKEYLRDGRAYGGESQTDQDHFPSFLGKSTLEHLAAQPIVGLYSRSSQHNLLAMNSREGDIVLLSAHSPSPVNGYTVDRFVSTLLNVYLFLFLVTSIIAIFLSESISRPLSALRARLKGFRLGRRNEKLVWNKNDEIGELINNYNDMVSQLEESAALMAMTERDSAWREMARQVAHEIKNPLTPMKLRVQHLLMTIERDPDNAQEHVRRTCDTLIEQIDNLSHIATEFASFGKMPKANNEKVILNDVVASVHDLFRKREDLQISLYIPIDEIYVFADRHHLNRILTNLIKNAIQSIPHDRKGIVEIRLLKEKNNALIVVQDNGTGIPKDKQASVFKPNFTTKNSGTGLGLAICSNLVDMFNGRIYFRSKVDVGTSFYVEIPMMRLQANFHNPKKVEL